MPATTKREFFMWGYPAELVIKIKHDNGSTVEVPVSDVTQYVAGGDWGEIRIPLRGTWLDKVIETTEFSSFKKGF